MSSLSNAQRGGLTFLLVFVFSMLFFANNKTRADELTNLCDNPKAKWEVLLADVIKERPEVAAMQWADLTGEDLVKLAGIHALPEGTKVVRFAETAHYKDIIVAVALDQYGCSLGIANISKEQFMDAMGLSKSNPNGT